MSNTGHGSDTKAAQERTIGRGKRPNPWFEAAVVIAALIVAAVVVRQS